MEQYKQVNTELKDKIYLVAVQSVAQLLDKTVRKKLDFKVQTTPKKKENFESFSNANQSQQNDFS